MPPLPRHPSICLRPPSLGGWCSVSSPPSEASRRGRKAGLPGVPAAASPAPPRRSGAGERPAMGQNRGPPPTAVPPWGHCWWGCAVLEWGGGAEKIHPPHHPQEGGGSPNSQPNPRAAQLPRKGGCSAVGDTHTLLVLGGWWLHPNSVCLAPPRPPPPQVCGVALIAIGIYAQTALDKALTVSSSSASSTPVAILVLGIIIFFISFFGCCGAWKESYCMVTTVSTLTPPPPDPQPDLLHLNPPTLTPTLFSRRSSLSCSASSSWWRSPPPLPDTSLRTRWGRVGRRGRGPSWVLQTPAPF